jgi:hypothetical protein
MNRIPKDKFSGLLNAFKNFKKEKEIILQKARNGKIFDLEKKWKLTKNSLFHKLSNPGILCYLPEQLQTG